MFTFAIQKASHFTFPVLISNKYYDGEISSNLGAFVIINEEGWFITAAHIIQQTLLFRKHIEEYQEFQNGKRPEANPKWMLNHSLWFGADHHVVEKYFLFNENDLAVGKIKNFDPNFVKEYPRFIQPSKVLQGKSLCKLGFPFYDIKATFSDNAFRYESSLFPIPRFPYEGMLTRIISGGKTADGQRDILWLETSSPGLRGQSGGPIFDTDGRIWALQSMTRHVPLGFSPKIIKNGVEIEENQFINLGWGVHVQSILRFLDENNVRYYSDKRLA